MSSSSSASGTAYGYGLSSTAGPGFGESVSRDLQRSEKKSLTVPIGQSYYSTGKRTYPVF